ncbi:MAG: Hpt domain-containing protein [Phycisphaerales bacterium]|nr:MAG: Hpt domain-containing protein [Phycisphaerales bacterium]
MNATPDASRHIVSELASDPDMVELVEFFVHELPARAAALETCLAQGDYKQLVRLAHQLKGAAGGYGFPTITEKAAVVEQKARDRVAPEEISSAIWELICMCRAARTRPDNA